MKLFMNSSLVLGGAVLSSLLPGAAVAGPYPALPPSLSTSVAPNVMLLLDTSASMLQDSSNQWLRGDLCSDIASNWGSCIKNDTKKFRTIIDSEVSTPNSKMNIAKRVSRNLIDSNPQLRWGVFSFHDKPTSIGGDERGEGGILRAAVRDGWVESNRTALKAAITALNGRTATPLGEALLEVSRYFRGETSLYDKQTGNYTSPIQYRCQKNFAIVITDGDATNDEQLPGSGLATMAYTRYGADGSAQSVNFSVCTDQGSNCPNALEGTGGLTTPGFGDKNNRPRAIRDVAKYALDADLITGTRNDLDGKSYDDPLFKLQNLITYTVGFSTLNNVLPAAAAVGGGNYYKADNEAELARSLNAAISQINASTSNAGGIAVAIDAAYAGNKVYQPVFNPKGWYGELRCKMLGTDGRVSGDCTVPQAIFPSHGNRNIYTSHQADGSAVTAAIEFKDAAKLAAWQRQALAPPSGDVQTARNVINFIRGQEGIAGFRTRTSLLGDMIGAQPVVVGKPTGSSSDPAYAAYKTKSAARSLVFIGANDGMMHAFDGNSMQELMGYVPAAVYENLSDLTKANYGLSTGTPHNWFVNGYARQADVRIGSAWKTLLVSGLAQGGRGYFALDASDSAQFNTAAAVRWERNSRQDIDMGHTFGSPLIYNVRNGNNTAIPAVILSNGYKNSAGIATDTSALFIVNADNGAVLQKITVPSKGGLSSPAGVDFGQDGVLDYVYAGDMSGKLWRFDLTGAAPADFKVETTPLFDAGTNQPIVMRPAVLAVNSKTDSTPIGNLVLFGTGKLQTDADRSDTSQQSFYAVLDKMDTAPITVSKSALQMQSVTDTLDKTSATGMVVTYRQLSNNTIDLTDPAELKRGWYLDLPESSERLITSPLLLLDKLLFGTGVPLASEKCLPGGRGWIMGVNPLTGGVVKNRAGAKGRDYSFIDLTGDKKSSAADMVDFSSGKSYISGFSLSGIPTELTFLQKNGYTYTAPANAGTALGDVGNSVALQEANAMAVYTGNAAAGTSAGNAMARPLSNGEGQLFVPQVGRDKVHEEELNKGAQGAKIETTLWWEVL
ncbi:hypothetical protein EGI20_07365 [Aquitalea sp. S1-19]|nr:hypothetical protein [Aquitalea sp. S1-19]